MNGRAELTWTELYGRNADGLEAVGRYIVERTGDGTFRVIHDAITDDMAIRVLEAWRSEK